MLLTLNLNDLKAFLALKSTSYIYKLVRNSKVQEDKG